MGSLIKLSLSDLKLGCNVAKTFLDYYQLTHLLQEPAYSSAQDSTPTLAVGVDKPGTTGSRQLTSNSKSQTSNSSFQSSTPSNNT